MDQVTPPGPTAPLLPSGQAGYRPSQRSQPGDSPVNPNHSYAKGTIPKLGDLGSFWSSFDQSTDDYNRDILDALKTSMDNLLIFAALFSAVNSAFIALSVPMLSADSQDETNRLLRLLVKGMDNSTLSQADIGPPPFSPSSDGMRINQLFSVSLTCSLLAAFGALLGQQWITSYKRRPVGGFDEERRERQRRLLGAKRWGLERVLELFLPMLLQISLIIFLVGMVEYLKSLSSPVALPNTILSWFGTAFVILSVLFALSDPHCPFKTPFSELADFFIRRSMRWLNGHRWVFDDAHQKSSYERIPLYLKAKGYLTQWFFRQWPNAVLEGHSITRILKSSADASTLSDMALNIPLINDRSSLEVIFKDKVAVSNLYQLYQIQPAQSNEKAAVYAAAICHLVLSVEQYDPHPTNHLLEGHELMIIRSAADDHISRPDDPVSLVPSSIVTVALAYLLSEIDSCTNSNDVQNKRIAFLRASIKTTATPDLPVACLAWILVSSGNLTRDPNKRRKAQEAIGFRESPPHRLQSGIGIFSYAAEAYHMFSKLSRDNVHRIPDKVLVCIAQAFGTQDPPTEASRTILSNILGGLTDILNTRAEVRRVSYLDAIVGAVHHLTEDGVIGPAAAKLTLAVLNRRKDLDVPDSTLKALEKHATTDKEIKSTLEDYLRPRSNRPTLRPADGSPP